LPENEGKILYMNFGHLESDEELGVKVYGK